MSYYTKNQQTNIDIIIIVLFLPRPYIWFFHYLASMKKMRQSKEIKQRIFLIFPSFLNLNIKLLGNLRGNSYAKFILLEIKSRFTCDESNIYWKVALFHYIISAIVFCSTCIIWIEKITSSCMLYELVVCVWMDLPQIQYFCIFFWKVYILKKRFLRLV